MPFERCAANPGWCRSSLRYGRSPSRGRVEPARRSSLMSNVTSEHADAVVVGSRIAGAAAAIAMARTGRHVIALDRVRFPSDTLSTHLMFPAHVAELVRLGALERVLAHRPPRVRHVMLSHQGVSASDRFLPVEGIDFGVCVPRPELDHALVETARAFGAEVREHSSVTDLLWDGDRVAGVRYRDKDSDEVREIRAPVTIGADGRRSVVAQLVGADRPYRGSRNGRGFVFWYMDDPKSDDRKWRETYVQWRAGGTHGMVFPTPSNRMLVSFMGPADRVALFRRDTQGMWERQLRENRRFAARVAGATNITRMRGTDDMVSFFRRSSGPGWALAGDAGHFKDPVLGQGIRDSLRHGRLVGEAVVRAGDDGPLAIDEALRAWEKERDDDCLPAYHWGNRETRIVGDDPLVIEALRTLAVDDLSEIGNAFSRRRNPEHVFGFRRSAGWLLRALSRPDADRGALLRRALGELLIDVDIRYERLLGHFRDSRPARSERPGWSWPIRKSQVALNGQGGAGSTGPAFVGGTMTDGVGNGTQDGSR
ncbi:MAG: NAD(P)/FAD-dependent oxidoreductase [Actinophytocola sp.]|nr:NAD(P)/FAD-dependent oxidoreductase [Actinophytocola sp.]